jgi:hypothetical protein
MSIGEQEKSGAEVRFTRIQWYDLISTLHILLDEDSYRKLPGKHESAPRIGPNGTDTWDIGTDIEKTTNPNSL